MAAPEWRRQQGRSLPRSAVTPTATVSLDHSIVAASDWEVSNQFYRDVLGAELVPHGPGDRVAYRLGDT